MLLGHEKGMEPCHLPQELNLENMHVREARRKDHMLYNSVYVTYAE